MYTPIAEISVDTIALSRRTFLKCSSVLGLCLIGCKGLLPKTQFANIMINDPHPSAFEPVLHGVIKSILPFEHQGFPDITPESVEARLFKLFPVEKEKRFVVLQRSLMLFNEVDLFPYIFKPIIAEEKKSNPADNTHISEKRRNDENLFNNFKKIADLSAKQFSALALDKKRSYLKMWGQSGFMIKRQLYHSLKALVMISAYSMDEMWSAIGYEGPLL